MDPASPWTIENNRPIFPKLTGSVEVDVAVIGGGISGMMTAYELSKSGKKVALLERARLGEGVTGWTTAFVTYVTDASLESLERRFGTKQGILAWETGRAAIRELERIVKEENIECDFVRCPAFVYAAREDDLKSLSAASYFMQAAGFASSLEKGELPFTNAGCLRIEDQAKFHPVKFLLGLAAKMSDAGVLIFERTEMIGYERGAGIIVKTPDGEAHAKELVLATYRPPENANNPQLISNQTYALEADLPAGSLPTGLYWDSEHPYHYFRVDHGHGADRIILGGEDRPTGSGHHAEHFSALEDFLRRTFPGINYELKKEWSGEILETPDGLPFIGALDEANDVFIMTGFSGNGMTFGVAGAMLIGDLLMGRKNEAIELLNPRRSTNETESKAL